MDFNDEDTENANEAALDQYRHGWSIGNSKIIKSVVADHFNFTWVPDNDIVRKAGFESFFERFKADVEGNETEKYFIYFDNIIQTQV